MGNQKIKLHFNTQTIEQVEPGNTEMEGKVVKKISLERLIYLINEIDLDISSCNILTVTDIPKEMQDIVKSYVIARLHEIRIQELRKIFQDQISKALGKTLEYNLLVPFNNHLLDVLKTEIKGIQKEYKLNPPYEYQEIIDKIETFQKN